MREILFRGKRLGTGEWVYGMPVRIYRNSRLTNRWEIAKGENIDELDYDIPSIYWEDEVDPETVSQYIGRKDDKGRRIYEGDIVLSDDLVYGEGGCFLIQWNEDWNGWDANRVGAKDDNYTIGELGDMEIVGNRWDTPNLLGGETQEGPDR